MMLVLATAVFTFCIYAVLYWVDWKYGCTVVWPRAAVLALAGVQLCWWVAL